MAERLIVHGELTTRRAALLRAAAAAAPGWLWITAIITLPGLLLAVMAFAQRGPDGVVVWEPSLANLRRLAGWGVFGWTGDYLRIALRTVIMAGTSTALALLLALPLCFAIAALPARRRTLALALVAIPFCTNVVVRTAGWMLAFSGNMPPAQLAQALDLIDQRAGLYPGVFAVQIGLITTALPLAMLPLYPAIERLDWTLVEAARDLYAGGWRLLRHAILPQIAPALAAAFMLTFIPSLGMFVVSDLLGGARTALLGNIIQQQFGPSRDWPFGAMVCLALILATLLGVWLMRRLARGGVET